MLWSPLAACCCLCCSADEKMPTLNLYISHFIAGPIIILVLTYTIAAGVLGLEVLQKEEVKCPKKQNLQYLLLEAAIFRINMFSFCLQRAAPPASTVQLRIRLL